MSKWSRGAESLERTANDDEGKHGICQTDLRRGKADDKQNVRRHLRREGEERESAESEWSKKTGTKGVQCGRGGVLTVCALCRWWCLVLVLVVSSIVGAVIVGAVIVSASHVMW